MLLPRLLLLVLLLEEVVAGHRQSGHQHHKLVKIHLVVLVGIQVVHDFLHQHRVFLGLQRRELNSFIKQLCVQTNEQLGFEGADATVWLWLERRNTQMLS